MKDEVGVFFGAMGWGTRRSRRWDKWDEKDEKDGKDGHGQTRTHTLLNQTAVFIQRM
jgi:hypothetical protein